MFKHETKTRMMAMAVVAMFMLTAFSIALVDNKADAAVTDVGGDGTENNPYTINLRTTDEFSYSPAANLGNVTFSAQYSTNNGSTWSDMPSDSTTLMNFSNNGLTGKYATAGTYLVKIKAHWEADELSQDAYQYIRFTVIEKFSVADISNVVFLQSTKSTNGTVATITTNNTPEAGIAWSVSAVEHGTETTTNIFAMQNATTNTASTSNAVTLSSEYTSLSIPDQPGYKIYDVTVTAIGQTSGINAASQTVSKQFSVTISKDVTAAAPVSINTFIGASGEYINSNVGEAEFSSPFTVSTNVEVGDVEDHVTPSVSDGDAIYTVQNDANSNYSFSESTINAAFNGTATYTVTGTVTGIEQPQDVDVTVNYKVYAKLGFTTTPTANASKSFGNPVNSLEVMASATLGYANKVIYNWGDNSSDTVNEVYGETSVVSASHTYAQNGVYKITITAVNDFGSASTVTLYNAGNDATLNPAPVHEITIKDGKDASRTIGKVTVEEGKTFKISSIEIDNDAKDFMTKKKVVALYTTAATDGKFDTTKMWNQANQVFSTSPSVLYADIQDTTATDDFFAEHGWLFIVFAILTVLGLIAIFYFGFQTPQVYIAVAIVAALTILLFVYKDFGGIWDAITGLFTKN